jgi:hypothetical protein
LVGRAESTLPLILSQSCLGIIQHILGIVLE